MRRVVNSKLEMAARVRVFSRAHPSPDPEYATVLGRLEERLARAEAIAGKQFEGLAARVRATARRQELRRVVQSQLLRYLVAVGGLASKSLTELVNQFRLPDGHANHRAFLLAVKSMLTMAGENKDVLVAEGMSPRLLEDLSRLVGEFETASEAARTARLDHIGARADLEEASRDILEQVQVLDGINRWRFGSEPELLVEWNAAKRLPVRSRNLGRPPSIGGAPGGEAPAA